MPCFPQARGALPSSTSLWGDHAGANRNELAVVVSGSIVVPIMLVAALIVAAIIWVERRPVPRIKMIVSGPGEMHHLDRCK